MSQSNQDNQAPAALLEPETSSASFQPVPPGESSPAPPPRSRAATAIQFLTVAIFCLALIAPAIQWKWEPVKIKPLNENRHRAARPSFAWKGALSPRATLMRETETWFNDHYGFRDFLIRLKNQVDFSLMNYSDEIYSGRGDYLFYKSVLDVDQIELEKRWADAAQREKFWENLDITRREFENRGMKFVFVLLPNKNSVYPEKMPSYAPRRPEDLVLFKFQRELESRGYNNINGYKSLMDHKPEKRLFHKTDFHWNNAGAAFVAKDLANYLGGMTGLGEIWRGPVPTRKQKNFSGGQNLSLATFHPPPEDTVASVAKLAGTSHIKFQEGPYRFSARRIPGVPGPALPKTVMLGDSFPEEFFATDFPFYFEELLFINYHGWRRSPPIPADTKIVLMIMIEPGLNPFLKDPNRQSYWPLPQALIQPEATPGAASP